MATSRDKDFSFEIIKDFGAFGDGEWQKHLTLIKWGNNQPTFDLRTWSPDMSKCGKGLTLTDADLFDLMGIIEEALGCSDSDDSDNSDSEDEYDDYNYDDEEDEDYEDMGDC